MAGTIGIHNIGNRRWTKASNTTVTSATAAESEKQSK
jgi:hypothetical protein